VSRIEIKCFTTYSTGLNRVLSNDVLISEAFTPAERNNPTEHNAQRYKAIWDTGATNTAITQRVVDGCGLKPIGVVEVHTAAGKFRTNKYIVNVWLPNRIIIPNVEVNLCELIDTNVLIGMNIINRGDFAVTNKDGRTVFSFRIPSVECIDFVRHPFKPLPLRTIPSRKRRR
jgi:predicted aspartyl protease